jgi:ubiquinone/menaquinone biosynthesis C-methylase UbiE
MSAFGRAVARGHDRVFAAVYDPFLAGVERAGLAEVRAELLASARGRTLEIGAGTGANLEHLPASVTTLTLVEPSDAMRARLTRRVAAQTGLPPTVVVPGDAADLGLPDASVDTLISTLVLCSVGDLATTLRELHRVLAPDGRLLLLEHVAGQGRTRRWQGAIDPVWRVVAQGCRLVRDTRGALEQAGFDTSEVTDWRLPGGGVTGPALLGIARRDA